MNENTKIFDLRQRINGKLYLFFRTDEFCRQFLQDAENEGYRFGKSMPTEHEPCNLITLENNRQLSHVGFACHVAVQCNAANLTTVDYERYINGERNIIFKYRT